MSRISKKPIQIPSNVNFTISNNEIVIKGPLGSLQQRLSAEQVTITSENNELFVKSADSTKQSHSMSGTIRSLVNNMVTGVTTGFVKRLNIVGVGYRAQASGNTLNLSLGFSHPIAYKMPNGITVETPTQTEIVIKGIDKQQVGQVAAEIRSFRLPEPYKGKGVRYADEIIILKETKKK
ncbi:MULTISPECIES: 50S ribosomal protein L6 [unclassified Nitrosomonas]|uniref:50S ribosomal protein L6 n=1 Tax=unclassified Nitrosomonas TaxID=2609265 RepID=UPI000895E6BC|nr:MULTISPECIES: 50S ribosomal protein L6 [unclassified Nitrosomonas]MDV6344529.1 50S ribosomal protein L6 [Nitrosomonas sp. Is37]SDY22511.1 large subunit ribosomal protein L6 [Nitrosomonas sp. Nm33]